MTIHDLGTTTQRPNESVAYANDTTANGSSPGSISNILKDLTALGNAVSIRNSSYIWTVSGSGTSEYYLTTSASGDPGLTEPEDVLENSEVMTEATVGSLTAAQWDWGDNDTLGFSTIYVRLTDSVDPDTKLVNWVEYAAEKVDISSANLSGSAADASGIITSQVVSSLLDGRKYRLIWRYTFSSAPTLEDYLDIICEQEG